jgi:hypothetical protein
MRYYPDGDSEQVVVDGVKLNSSIRWATSATFSHWTNAYRVDVMPANTTLVPNNYGFNKEHRYCSRPVVEAPTSKFLDYPTYGSLVNVATLTNPFSNLSPYSNGGFTVTDDGGKKRQLGPGDYRFLVSVLRWGGDVRVLADYDTWLGPLVQIVDGPI